MTELLVQPYRDDSEQRVNDFYGLLSTYPNLEWIAPNLAVADSAARIRGKHGLRTPDALQAATAVSGASDGFHALAAKFPETTVILDHMGRPADGTEEEYSQVLKLAELPRVVMKYSGWDMYKGDLNRLTSRIYDAFGPDHLIWGMLGNTLADYRKQWQQLDELLAFASEADRAKGPRRQRAEALFHLRGRQPYPKIRRCRVRGARC